MHAVFVGIDQSHLLVFASLVYIQDVDIVEFGRKMIEFNDS